MSKTVSITLSDVQAAEINELMTHMRNEPTFAQAVQKCIDSGITQMQYHYKRNATQWKQQKANKQLLNQLLRERAQWQSKQVTEDDDEIVARD